MEQVYTCPHCGTALDVVPASTPQDVACPQCGGLTVIPALDESGEDDPAQTAPVDDREDELSALRIRQLAAARRAAYRSRSYCVIGSLVCVVGAVQLTWMAIAWMRISGVELRPLAYLLVSAVAVWWGGFFYGKAIVLDCEAKQSSLNDVTAEPDFAPLSDGSQRWKNLEKLGPR